MIRIPSCVPVLVVVLAFVSSTAVLGKEPNATQAKMQKQIESNASRLTKFAYVSSNGHTKTTYVEGKEYTDDSFSFTYRFDYRDSDNDPQQFTMKFHFDANGKFTKFSNVSYSSFWEPFNAWIIAGVALEEIGKAIEK